MLAVDSRVTLNVQAPGQPFPVPAFYDHARKLLRVAGQDHIGVITYGMGVLGQAEPRTAHSFLPDLERDLQGEKRLTVGEFSQRLSRFFLAKWNQLMPAEAAAGGDMVFLIAGYDPDEPYGRVYEVFIPSQPAPKETQAGQFGLTWGGQREIVDRILQGVDPRLPSLLSQFIPNLSVPEQQTIYDQLKSNLSLPIPYPFLPLQDCVNLSTLLIQTTAQLQTWVVGVRGVGGPVDVATITRTEGFREIQVKKIVSREDMFWRESG